MIKLPRVYVVVLNWNGAADTVACLQSLHELTHENCCYVICDNQSRNDSVAMLRQWGANLPMGLPEFHASPTIGWAAGQPRPVRSTVLIHTGGNLGYAGGMNVGIQYAMDQGDADYIWILNNDTTVESNSLSELLQRMRANGRIGICGSTLVYADDRQKIQALGGAAYLPWRGRSVALGAFSQIDSVPIDPVPVEEQMAYVVGASMLVTRRFVERVGPMDPSYFLYSEEHDWAHRGRAMGFLLGYAPRSIVFHKHGATIGTSSSGGSDLSLYYLYRNKAVFAARYDPYKVPIVLLWLIWDGLKFALKGQPTKTRAVFRGLLAFPKRRSY